MFGYSSWPVAAGDTVLPSTPATSTTFFTGSLSPFESSAPTNTTTANIPTNSSSSVSNITTLTAAQSTVFAPESVTDPASCFPEQNEVAAILASQCEKLLSCQAARRAQGRGQNEMHVSAAQPRVFGTTWSETPSSSKPVNDDALTPACSWESKPCSVPTTSTPSTSTRSASLDSKSGSSVLARRLLRHSLTVHLSIFCTQQSGCGNGLSRIRRQIKRSLKRGFVTFTRASTIFVFSLNVFK